MGCATASRTHDPPTPPTSATLFWASLSPCGQCLGPEPGHSSSPLWPLLLAQERFVLILICGRRGLKSTPKIKGPGLRPVSKFLPYLGLQLPHLVVFLLTLNSKRTQALGI